MKSLSAVCLIFLLAAPIYGQTGSINNKLGDGGTFTVKDDANQPLVVVQADGTTDINGQLTVDRIRVSGVPSFTAMHIPESDMGTTDTLITWTEASGEGSHDNSNSFNESTGEFTAPRNGLYFLSAGIEIAASAPTVTLYIFVNSGASSLAARSSLSTIGATNLSTSGVLKLNAGEVVTLRVIMVSPAGPGSAGTGWFSGYLVSDF